MKLPSLSELAREVTASAAVINECFGENLPFSPKHDFTPVTEIDHAINTRLKRWATEHGLGFLGEEGNGTEEAEYYLYVDPLDGTGAFLRGMATVTTVACIMKRDGDVGIPLRAVIHNPITGQTWMAEKEYGAYYHRGTAIRRTTLPTAQPDTPWLVSICSWPGADERFLSVEAEVARRPHTFADQKMGALAIGGGLIASGLLHAVAVGPTSAVETAAMSLIVHEAGGVCVDLDGSVIDSFAIDQFNGKRDFVLPRGAVLSSHAELAYALTTLSKEAA